MADGDEKRGPWTSHRRTHVYENPWISVTEHQVTNPWGEAGIYGVVHLRNLAVGCVPVFDDGSILLVGQHRFPLDVYSWELPEGGGGDDDPQDAAARELKEETGYTARSWAPLMTGDLSNAVTDERAVGFLAWDLEAGAPDPQDGEMIELRRLPFAEALEMAVRGEIRDIFSQVMLLQTDVLGHKGRLPEPVARRLGYN